MANEDKKQIPAVPDDVLAVAKTLADVVKLEIKDGAASAEVASEHYVKFMTEGDETITEKLLKKIQDKNEIWYGGVGQAAVEAALPLFQSNKAVQSANITSKLLGRDTFDANVAREVEVRIPDSDKVSTQYGVLSAKIKINGSRHKVGALSIVRENAKAKFAAALA